MDADSFLLISATDVLCYDTAAMSSCEVLKKKVVAPLTKVPARFVKAVAEGSAKRWNESSATARL